ncbi:hypothetical protein C8R45DRAFT_947505 [Mycena sanguinolenta]|nr:hypothetical protein C8R45DRAFT_947505 [Mycena sanguinolenta]
MSLAILLGSTICCFKLLMSALHTRMRLRKSGQISPMWTALGPVAGNELGGGKINWIFEVNEKIKVNEKDIRMRQHGAGASGTNVVSRNHLSHECTVIDAHRARSFERCRYNKVSLVQPSSPVRQLTRLGPDSNGNGSVEVRVRTKWKERAFDIPRNTKAILEQKQKFAQDQVEIREFFAGVDACQEEKGRRNHLEGNALERRSLTSRRGRAAQPEATARISASPKGREQTTATEGREQKKGKAENEHRKGNEYAASRDEKGLAGRKRARKMKEGSQDEKGRASRKRPREKEEEKCFARGLELD